MRKRWLPIGIAVVLIIAIVLIITRTKKEPKKITIGVILPLTADGAIYGKEIRQGIELAIEEINNEGGIEGKKIIAIYEDDQGLPKLAVSALQKLISYDKTKIIIGGAFSSSALAMLPVCNQQKVLLFSPTASSPDLSKPNDYFFRNWPSDTFEGNTMADFAVSNLNLKTFAILYSNSEYGLGLRDVFEKKVHELGGNIIIKESFSEGDTDFRTQLNKIKLSNPEGIYLVGWYKEFSLILRQAKDLGIQAQFLSCVTFNKPELLELVGSAAEGIYFTQPAYDSDSNEATVKNFLANYEKKFGKKPGVYAAHGYDAVKLVAFAMEKRGTEPEDVRTGLSSIKNYPGVSGKTTFDLNGDVAKAARIFIVKNGHYVSVED